jgi:hypothetical protein
MADIFDQPPFGFVRSKSKGWSVVAVTPQKRSVDKIKLENSELKSRLDQLEVLVADLTNKKKK